MNREQIRRWRIDKRKELIDRRRNVQSAAKTTARRKISDLVRGIIAEKAPANAVIGGYWPIKGEINLIALFREFVEQGHHVAMPVVVEKNAPVEFWRWTPAASMARGFWDIPVPATRDPLKPDLMIVPLVGFDDDCFRLGNGGGYYDRTLAKMAGKPLCIGVGYEFSALTTIYPQAHDVPMDMVVTEETDDAQTVRVPDRAAERNAQTELASSPCSMAEADPSYLGFLSRAESLDLLASLLLAVHTAAGTAMEIMLFGDKSYGAKFYFDLMYGDIQARRILQNAKDKIALTNDECPIAREPAAGDAGQSIASEVDLLTVHDQAAGLIRNALPKIADPLLYDDLTKVLRLQERALRKLGGGKHRPVKVTEEWRNAI